MCLRTCHYEGCYNQRKTRSSITFFNLPPDEPRRSHWILNSGNKKLKNLTKTQVRHFCEKHFRQKDIRTLGYRKVLHRHAVPLIHQSVRINYVMHELDGSTTTKKTLATDNPDFTNFQEAAVNDYQNNSKKADQNGHKDDEEEVCSSTYHQQNELSDGAELNLTSNKDCFKYGIVGADKQEVLNPIMKSHDSLCELEVELFSNKPEIAEENVTNEIIDIDLEHEDVQTITNTVKAVAIASPNSYSIAENIDNYVEDLLPTYRNDFNSSLVEDYQSNSTPSQELPTTLSVVSTTCSNDNTRNIATAVSMLSNAENEEAANDLNISTEADSSYESDKHYALSLVYLFQRLNGKKKTKAKIDILTYLLALENDDGDDVLVPGT